jgi:hypothetical protein
MNSELLYLEKRGNERSVILHPHRINSLKKLTKNEIK